MNAIPPIQYHFVWLFSLKTIAPAFHNHEEEIPVVKTIASQKEGIALLKEKMSKLQRNQNSDRKLWLLAEKAYQLIRNKRMKDVNKQQLKDRIAKDSKGFNLYKFVSQI